jgi:hypothetical protein
LFSEERKGRNEDAALSEVEGDERPALVGEGSDGGAGAGGTPSPSRV